MRSLTPIQLYDDAKKRAISSIRRYLSENLDEPIDDLKATLVLEYVLAEFGPTIYNHAIADAQAFLSDRIAVLDAVSDRAGFPFWSKPRAGDGRATGGPPP